MFLCYLYLVSYAQIWSNRLWNEYYNDTHSVKNILSSISESYDFIT